MNTLKNGMTHFSKATPVRMLLLFFVSLVSLAMLWILDNEVEFMVFLFLGVALFFVSTAVNLADARTRTEADNIHSQSEMEFGLTAIKSHCIVSFTDTNDRIVEVNQKLLDAFEYALEDVIGQSPQILHDGIGDESVFNKIHSNLTRGRVWVGEHSAVTKSGKRKFFQATVIPLMDARGKYV